MPKSWNILDKMLKEEVLKPTSLNGQPSAELDGDGALEKGIRMETEIFRGELGEEKQLGMFRKLTLFLLKYGVETHG